MRNSFVVIGLGSNLDHPIQNLRLALKYLKAIPTLKVINVSSIYESDAQLPDQSDPSWNIKYLNAAVLCEVVDEFNLEPMDLLHHLKQIEIKMGRIKTERWAPRYIDLDILYWHKKDGSSLRIQNPDLTVPHPELLSRPFALLPLLDVFPEVSLPNIPEWARGYSSGVPFGTQISFSYFWPKFVGVLNITSDSFSDGGLLLQKENLYLQAEKLLQSGATLLDVGAESTRPGAKSVSEDVEYRNLIWALGILRDLKKQYHFEISLDCRRPQVLQKVLEKENVHFLNDVTGFQHLEMKKILKNFKGQAFVMHSLGIPPSEQAILPEDKNPLAELNFWWKQKKIDLIKFGIENEQIIFDPGIGFGKTKNQNFYILNRLDQFNEVSNDILIGHSRKSYQTIFSHRPPEKRDAETALVTERLNMAYVQYLRVHDIETQKSALQIPSLNRMQRA